MNIPANRPVETVEEQKEEKKKAERITFKPEHLIRPEGIKKLYNMGKEIKLKPNEDAKNLKKIIDTLKKWHFDLMFKYNFEFFMDRCQAFGTTKQVQNHMNMVRKIHKGQAQWEDEDQRRMIVEQPEVPNVPARQLSVRSEVLSQPPPKRQQPMPRAPLAESSDEQDQQVLQAMMKQMKKNIEQRDEIPEEQQHYQFGAVEYEQQEVPEGFLDD